MADMPPLPSYDMEIAQADRRPAPLWLRFFDRFLKATSTRTTVVVSTVAPTTTDIPDGEFRVWRNTGAGTVRLYANSGGVLVSTLLS